MGALSDVLRQLNRAALWKVTLPVWGERMAIPSADRLLYGLLHVAGVMGSADRRFFASEVKPGMTVLDVGANIGLYALLFSRLVGDTGSVYAFEPDPQLYQALERAVAVNGRANLRPFPLGLSDTTGSGVLEQSFFNSGDNRVRIGGAAGGPAISLARGDDLLPTQSVDFIKIDVQGWELHALRGLSAVIARSPRVQVYFEFWPGGLQRAGCNPQDLLDFLVGADFSLWQWKDGAWRPAAPGKGLGAGLKGQGFINLWAKKCA